MARINQQLLERLQQKLGLGLGRVYALIAQTEQATFLPKPLAALKLAAENGIGITRFASAEDLATIRQASATAPTPGPAVHTVSLPEAVSPTRTRKRKKASKTTQQRRGTSVFVVHGRNHALRRALFSFLRSVGITPIEWRKAIQLTGKASPYVSEILDAAFREAVAVVVLLSPDDETRLKKDFQKSSDPAYEKRLAGQARPNVLFEAGMAFGRNPDSTVLVQVGDVKPFSGWQACRSPLELDREPSRANHKTGQRGVQRGCRGHRLA